MPPSTPKKKAKKSIFDDIDMSDEQLPEQAIKKQEEELQTIQPKFEDADIKTNLTVEEVQQYKVYEQENSKLLEERENLLAKLNDYIEETDKLKEELKKLKDGQKTKENSNPDKKEQEDKQYKANLKLAEELEALKIENKTLRNEISRLTRKTNQLVNRLHSNDVQYSRVKHTMQYDSWN